MIIRTRPRTPIDNEWFQVVTFLERELAAAQVRNEELEIACATGWGEPQLVKQLKDRIAELEAILPESLAAIEEIHGDHCSAWCGYRELRVKLRAAIDAARKEGE